MHGDVGLVRQQGLLDLLGEQSLAAHLRQRPVLDAVARRLDRLYLELINAGAVHGLQPRLHLAGLRKRQR